MFYLLILETFNNDNNEVVLLIIDFYRQEQLCE
mgnify:CR=1 FL=1